MLSITSKRYVACVLYTILLNHTPATAQRSKQHEFFFQQMDICRDGTTPDVMINSCTAALETITEPSESIFVPILYNNRGLAYQTQNDLPRAIADYDSALRFGGLYANTLVNRGTAYWAQNDQTRAMVDFNEAIRIDQQVIGSYMKKGITLPPIPQASLNKEHARSFFNRAVAHHKLGQLPKAISDYSEAIRLKPQNTDAFFNRGLAHKALNQNEDAIMDFSDAIRIKPEYRQAYTNRAYLNLLLSNWSAAWSDYDASLRLSPNDSIALYGRGLAARRLGKTTEGEADIAEAIKVDANVNITFADLSLNP